MRIYTVSKATPAWRYTVSMVPRCVACDARVHPYAPEALCARCQQPCPTCGGDVQHCQHPLRAEQLTTVHGDPLKDLAA